MRTSKFLLYSLPLLFVAIFANATYHNPSSDVTYEKVRTLVDHKLTTEIKKKAGKYGTPTKMYSRCPSGIFSSVGNLAKQNDSFSTGEINV